MMIMWGRIKHTNWIWWHFAFIWESFSWCLKVPLHKVVMDIHIQPAPQCQPNFVTTTYMCNEKKTTIHLHAHILPPLHHFLYLLSLNSLHVSYSKMHKSWFSDKPNQPLMFRRKICTILLHGTKTCKLPPFCSNNLLTVNTHLHLKQHTSRTSESWQNAQMSSHIWLPHLDSELEHARYLSLSKLQMLSIQVYPSITTVDARYIFVYIRVCMCLYLSASLYVSVTPKFLPCVWR